MKSTGGLHTVLLRILPSGEILHNGWKPENAVNKGQNVGQIIRQAVLVGYFAKKNEAQNAIRELAQRGFRRTALIQKRTEGDVHFTDPFFRRRVLRLTLAAILSGGSGGLASLCLHWSPSLSFWNIPTALMVTLVWLYMEILRLLSKLNSRR